MAYLRLNFSTRPAASTNFCLPVKKGWQSEQISTWIVGTVERVSTTWPQAQMIFAGLYSGWMPSFIKTSDQIYSMKDRRLQTGRPRPERRKLLQYLLQLRHQGRVDVENLAHGLFQRRAVEGVDVELGLLRVRLELRVFHRVHKRLAQDLDAVLRRAGRHNIRPRRRSDRMDDGANKLLALRSEEHTSELQSRGLISYAVFC